MRLQIARVKYARHQKGSGNNPPPACFLHSRIPNQPKQRVVVQGRLNPRMREVEHLASGKLVSQRQQNTGGARKSPMAEQQQHPQSTCDKMKYLRPVVSPFKRRERQIGQRPNRVCSVVMRIGQQWASGPGVRIPPRDFAVPPGIVNGIMDGQISSHLVHDIMIARNPRGCRIHKMIFRSHRRQNVQWRQQGLAPQGLPKYPQAQ